MLMTNRISIRIDERTKMLLHEISDATGVSVAVVIRSFIMREVDLILDREGYIRIKNEKKTDKR
jgi:antitoxin component of RelBE/YafQ-DinJ toxin-antitoxin module